VSFPLGYVITTPYVFMAPELLDAPEMSGV
jgi:hypothetical protein